MKSLTWQVHLFGSYAAGDVLDMQSVGVYSQLRRRYVLVAKLRWHQQNQQPSRWKTSEGQNVPIRKVALTSTLTVLSLLLITVPAAYFTRLLMLLVSKSLLPAL